MAVKKAVKVKPAAKVVKETGIRASVVGTDGKAAGSVTLPSEYFGQKVNKQLIALATRVYLANQRVGNASTKTRGQVEGSTRKIYKQKGTGRARHGAIRAPIFVGGGIVFGPKPRDYSMKFPHKMKQAALASALSQQYEKGNVKVVSGLTDLKPKTKLVAKAFGAIGLHGKTLLVVPNDAEAVVRASRNLDRVDVLPVTDLHTYGVMTHGNVVFMKEALAGLKK